MRAPKTTEKSSWLYQVRNDYALANVNYEQDGEWVEEVLEIVPLSKIEQRPWWNPSRRKENYDFLKRTGRMPPVSLSYDEQTKTYMIADGIHRVDAARTLGYDAVPAIVGYVRRTKPPADPNTEKKRSEMHGWDLAQRIKRQVKGPIDYVNVRNQQPGSFELEMERNDEEREYKYLLRVVFEEGYFLVSMSGDVTGEVHGSMDEVAAAIGKLVSASFVSAWVRKNCKFSAAKPEKAYHCRIFRGDDVKAEGDWFDVSQKMAETHFMFSAAGRDRLKVHIWKQKGWRCQCEEKPEPPRQPEAKKPTRMEQGRLF